jgi:OOP family OmpA-OmpF porin
MKKTIIGLSIISTSILSANISVSTEFTRNNVIKSPINYYNTLGLRITNSFKNQTFTGLEIERSEKFQNHRLNRYQIIQGYQLKNKTKFTPYIYMGLGYETITNYNNSWLYSLGLGSKYQISNNFDLFAEIRGIRDFHNNDYHAGGVIGISYNFGKEQENHNNQTIKPIIPTDSDNDGIPDNIDKCPNTPAGVKVNKQGCPVDSDKDGVPDYLDKCPNTPVGVKVDKQGCPVDSDKDGVPDYLDKCPNTPVGVKVDKQGCPVDSDKDGIPDYLDKCVHTPKGVKVDKNGCPVSFTFDITFKFNSYKIEPQFMPEIKKFADFLKQNPGYNAEIEGYTDNLGSPVYNKLLSLKRAKAVYEALIKEGIDKKRLKFAGYGEENPIAPNTTPEGRAKNRRVVAKLFF